MQNDNEAEICKQQLTEELQLVKYRIKMLDIIELKLFDMRKLAEYAEDNLLSFDEVEAINKRLKELSLQIKCINEESNTI